MTILLDENVTRPDPRAWPAETGRFAVTGTRNWPYAKGWIIRDSIRMVFNHMYVHRLEPVMLEGCCPTGADHLATRIWRQWNREPEHHPADWDHCDPNCPKREHRVPKKPGDLHHPGELDDYCPKAGPRRNREMVRANIDLLLAYPGNREERRSGTWNCVQRAREAGVPVLFPGRWDWDDRTYGW